MEKKPKEILLGEKQELPERQSGERRRIKVVPLKPRGGPKPDFDRFPDQIPRKYSAVTAVGPRMAGKSTLFCFLVEKFYARKGGFDDIVILSPTAFLDDNWKALREHTENERTHPAKIHFMDKCNDEILGQLLAAQKKRFMETPEEEKCKDLLIMVDDMGTSRDHTQMMEKLYQTARHYKIMTWQNLQFLRSVTPAQRVNTLNWFLWGLPDTEIRKLAEELKCGLTEQEFYDYFKESTKEPYSFCHINYKRPDSIFNKGLE